MQGHLDALRKIGVPEKTIARKQEQMAREEERYTRAEKVLGQKLPAEARDALKEWQHEYQKRGPDAPLPDEFLATKLGENSPAYRKVSEALNEAVHVEFGKSAGLVQGYHDEQAAVVSRALKSDTRARWRPSRSAEQEAAHALVPKEFHGKGK